ncbi:membrane bound O-acyl transferase family-domain-containing protein [Aspergillus oleicola]
MSPVGMLVAIMLCEYLISSTALAFTTRRSRARKLCLLMLLATASIEIRLLSFLAGPELLRGVFAFSCLVKLLHFISIFHILQVEIHQILNPVTSTSRIACLRAALNCVTSTRGIGTPWEVKKRGSSPQSQRQRLKKGHYITRSLAILLWHYMALDLLNFGALRYFHREWPHVLVDGAEFLTPGSVTRVELLARLPLSFILAANLRLLFAAIYGFLSVLCVTVQLSSPTDWPPLFGTLRDLQTFSIRGFWGQYWHQLLRWPLVIISTYIRRNFVPFPLSSRAQSIMDHVVVFSLSGVLHMLSAVYAGVPGRTGAIFLFFFLNSVVIIVEDFLSKPARQGQEQGKKVGPRSSSRTDRPVGGKGGDRGSFLRFIWAFTWFYVSTPLFAYTALRLPVEKNAVMPVSFVEIFGALPMVGVAVGLGWVIWAVTDGEGFSW